MKQPIETVICSDRIEYTFFESMAAVVPGTVSSRQWKFVMRDLDSRKIISVIQGPESIIRAKFDAVVSKVSIVSRGLS